MKAHRRCRSIALLILYLGTKWRQVVNCMHPLLPPHPPEKNPSAHEPGGWMDSGAYLDVPERKKSCPCWDLNPKPTSP